MQAAAGPSRGTPAPDPRADAVVIGGGVNELVAAHYLARAGLKVLVLAPDHAPDGFEPGWMPPVIAHDLELARAGLALGAPDPWATTPLPDGGRLELWHDMARTVEAIGRVSPRDAARWPAFCERMSKVSAVLETLYTAPPPEPLARGWRELARLAGVGLAIRRRGRHTVQDLLRVLPMPVADLLDDWFECDALKGILGAAGVMHVRHGPRAGGTAFCLLHHHVGSPAGVFRPPRSNVTRILERLPGIELRRGAAVAHITVREGRVNGVVLADGEVIAAPHVVSGLDPVHSLTELLDPGWLDPAFARAVRGIRARGVVARVTLTLEREPGFNTLVNAPSLDFLEQAADDAKYGRLSRLPLLEARNAGATGDGRHHVDVHVQFAPYALASGSWDESAKAALARGTVEYLAPHAPALAASIVKVSVHSPLDLEREFGYPEGQAHHAEIALDQALWMRPVPGAAHYRMPVEGLYLAGPGTHPGAGTIGAAGRNAAREVLHDLRRGNARREGRTNNP